MTAADDPLGWLGCTIDQRFAVEALIGEGGFGLVYRGTHLGFEEPVAIKILKLPSALTDQEQSAFLREFRDEARLLHKLSRKTTGIVQALDVGAAVSPTGQWTPYIVMEWLDGVTLEDQLFHARRSNHARRSLKDAVALLTPVAESVSVAHLEHVAHLDVKPANIFLLRDGGIKLLDFGIAKVLTASETMARAFTRAGTLPPFTPAYGAPEQFNPRHGQTGPWTDVFALGLILIELCSGEMALYGDSPVQLYIAAANEQSRPSLAAHGIRVSPEVESVLQRALEVDPHRRYRTADLMWSALRQAADLSWMGVTAPSLAPHVSVIPPGGERSVGSETADTAVPAPMVAPTGMNRICTVLFAEVEAGDAAEHLDPEQLGEFLERCTSAVIGAVTALGGTVERTLREGVMAYFGLYDDTSTAAERAIHAAIRAQSALADLAHQLRVADLMQPSMRAGIATGRVFVSPQQSSAGFKLSAAGAPVKVGARLQQDAPGGSVYVDRDTYRQVSGLFDAEVVNRGDAGRQASSVAYRIRGLSSSRHELDVDIAREFHGLATRMVGRTAEMEALVTAADLVAEDGCTHLLTVIGTAGMGKSRLLAEFAQQLAQRDWVVFAATCSSVHQQASFGLAATLMRARFHLHDDDDRGVAAGKLRRGLRMLASQGSLDSKQGLADLVSGRLFHIIDEDEVVEQLLLLLGLVEERGQPLSSQEESAGAKHRLTAAFASMLRPVRGPVAILCDDVHWADESSLSLLEDLCARLAESPVLVIVSTRPELFERRTMWGENETNRQRLQLRPMSRRHLEEMTRDRLQQVPDLPPDRVRLIAEHAEGSPLALVETLNLLIDTGTIDVDDEFWTFHEHRFGDLELPTTVQGVVQARLDRLPEAARALLAHAAVVGPMFWDGLLNELRPADGIGTAPTNDVLSLLRERGMVRVRASSRFPDHQEYVFVESSTQRVAYEMLGRRDRRRLHALVAQWLEQRISSDAGAAMIGSHYEQAAALPEALSAYRRAGAHAASLGQNAEARDCYQRACSIDEQTTQGASSLRDGGIALGSQSPEDLRVVAWPDRVALRMELGDVLRRMGLFDLAAERYQQASEQIVTDDRRTTPSDPVEIPRWQARLAYRDADLHKLRGETEEAARLIELAIAHAERGALQEELAEAWALAASLYRRQRRFEACREACLRGLRTCGQVSKRDNRWRQAVSKLLNALGAMFQVQGRLVPAERCYLQAVRVIDERRNPDQASRALNNVAAVRYARGELEGARTSFRQAVKLAERSGDSWVKLTILANLGEVELALERHDVALRYLDAALKLSAQLRATIDLPEVHRNIARARLRTGEPSRALDHIGDAVDLVAKSGGDHYRAPVLCTAAEICAELAGRGELADRTRALGERVLAAIDKQPLARDQDEHCRALLQGASGR